MSKVDQPILLFTKRRNSVSISQLLDITVCNFVFSTQTWNNAATFSQLILGAVVCTLVMAKFMRDSFQMYRATQKLQLNRYVSLLVRDGLLYFLVYVPSLNLLVKLINSLDGVMVSTFFYTLTNMLGMLGTIPAGWVTQMLMVAADVPVYTLTPRFVMNIRELYVLDLQGRCGGDIDTGFGLSSTAGRDGRGTTMIETIAFADGGEIGVLREREEIMIAAAERSDMEVLVV